MRFISPYAQYRLIMKHDTIEVGQDGIARTVQKGFTVEFRMHDLTEFEREYARQHLSLKDKGVRKDTGVPADPVNWVSSYDTASIEDPKFRAEVEEFMLSNPDFGNGTMGYVLVETPKLSPPWPKYDELTIHGQRTAEKVAAKNIEIAQAIGVGLDVVIAYERQERNDARIIAAYEAAEAEQESEQVEELVQA